METEEQKQRRRAKARARYAANPEKYREATRKWRAKQPDKYHGTRAEAVARWRRQNPDKYREQHLRRKYGISLAEHDAMLSRQHGRCAACRTDQPGGKSISVAGTWHVDHCHKTGEIRGLLCFRCNTTAGVSGDDPRVLRAIADYLEGNAR